MTGSSNFVFRSPRLMLISSPNDMRRPWFGRTDNRAVPGESVGPHASVGPHNNVGDGGNAGRYANGFGGTVHNLPARAELLASIRDREGVVQQRISEPLYEACAARGHPRRDPLQEQAILVPESEFQSVERYASRIR